MWEFELFIERLEPNLINSPTHAYTSPTPYSHAKNMPGGKLLDSTPSRLRIAELSYKEFAIGRECPVGELDE